MSNSKTKVLAFVICALVLFMSFACLPAGRCFGIWNFSYAQEGDLEFTLDVTANTIPLPKIFRPNIDLSGRGFHRQLNWPQGLAAIEVLDAWQRDIGFNGLYRMQYNLWEINKLAKDKDSQDKLLSNYENIIKSVSDAGAVVILDIFGTPAGLGKVLDKKSPPIDMRAFKGLIKSHIQNLSCNKKYNIWYEVWSAPDSDDFFLGRQQEYFNLYRSVAESIKELEKETKIHIPLGGPSVSWWFQSVDGNTILTPERSLIYGLIKFCGRYRLPLDFISWHSYSTDPRVDNESTIYNKTAVNLIRDWLSYFNFARNTPLIIDEWNYDSGANILPERNGQSHICASYILNRIKNMYNVGLDYQLYFSLEDFQDNKEGVVRNTGIFWFDPKSSKYEGGHKSTYNVFRMLASLGSDMFSSLSKVGDDFAGVIAGKSQDSITLLIYNYIDPLMATNYISKNIAILNDAQRKFVLRLVKSDSLEKILRRESEVPRRATNKTKNLLKKAQELNDKVTKFKELTRNIKLAIKNLNDNYLYQRYIIDSSCSLKCEFIPAEEKELSAAEVYNETLALSPYSVNMIILKKQKPKEAETVSKVSGLANETEKATPAITLQTDQNNTSGEVNKSEVTKN